MTSTSPPSSPAEQARAGNAGRPGSAGRPGGAGGGGPAGPIDEDERDALVELVGELRASIERHYRAGRWAASADPSPRYAAPPVSAEPHVAPEPQPSAAPASAYAETESARPVAPAMAAREAAPAPTSAYAGTSGSASMNASDGGGRGASGRGFAGPEPESGRFDEIPLDDSMGPPPDESWGGMGMPDFDDAPPAWASSSGSGSGSAGGRGAPSRQAGPGSAGRAASPSQAPSRAATPSRNAPAPQVQSAASKADSDLSVRNDVNRYLSDFFDGPLAIAGSLDEDGVPRPRKTLATVRADLGDCQRCKLAKSRNKIVFGTGAEDAPLVFVGEAPGADEDRTGEPFVGRAGQLLDKMIEAMGWSRSSVYIANLLKCRPPNNRNPEPDEAAACRPFLISQLEVLAPRIIVALGRPSANALLSVDAPIGALRGKFHERMGLKIMPSFHPAYLLRDPSKKREAWADLQLVMNELVRIGVTPRR